MTSSVVESSLLYLKAAYEALGKDLEALTGNLQQSSGTTASLAGAIQQLEGTSVKTQELLTSLAKQQAAHHSALELVAAEAKKGNEQRDASLMALRQLENRMAEVVGQAGKDRHEFELRLKENTAQLRRELEILGKTLTASLLELRKPASAAPSRPEPARPPQTGGPSGS
jgi:phage-related minor tail protein